MPPEVADLGGDGAWSPNARDVLAGELVRAAMAAARDELDAEKIVIIK